MKVQRVQKHVTTRTCVTNSLKMGKKAKSIYITIVVSLFMICTVQTYRAVTNNTKYIQGRINLSRDITDKMGKATRNVHLIILEEGEALTSESVIKINELNEIDKEAKKIMAELEKINGGELDVQNIEGLDGKENCEKDVDLSQPDNKEASG